MPLKKCLICLIVETVVFSRWDRIGRNAAFLMSLQESGAELVAADNPHISKMVVGILALVAQQEVETLSLRVRQALVVAKQRGKTLGNPRLAEARKNAHKAIQERKTAFSADARKAIQEIQSTGISTLLGIASCLNKRGEKSSRGGAWTATAVRRVLEVTDFNQMAA